MPKIGDYIKIKHGFAFKGTGITTEDNDVVLVTPGNFCIGGGFKEEKCKFFSEEYPEDYVLHEDDLIVTMTDLSRAVDTLGYSALVPNSGRRTYLHNQRIGLVQFLSDEINKHYLYWFMRTPKYQSTIAATSSGSTVHHTSPDRICDVDIELPEMDVQRKIASFLDQIEAKININNQLNRNLSEQALTIFKQYSEEASESIPFTEKIKVLGGGTPKTVEPSYWNGDIPFFTPKDVGTPYTFTTEKNISEDGLHHCNSRLYPINTTFVTARGTVGKVALAGVPMAMNQSCYALASDELDPLLVYFYTVAAIDSLKHKASGAVFDAIVTRDFETEKIKQLGDSVMQEFIGIISPIFEQIHKATMENQRLVALRDSLLPKLMSGELDVSEVDI